MYYIICKLHGIRIVFTYISSCAQQQWCVTARGPPGYTPWHHGHPKRVSLRPCVVESMVSTFTKLISKARTDGSRSVGLPNSKSHSFSLFITFFHFLSLFFTLMELKWKKQLFEIFSTASWTATAVSKRQLISCHTKWEKTTMMLLYGIQTQMVRVFSNQCSVIRHP